MNDAERIRIEEELLMTKSKSQVINLYLDALDNIDKLEKENFNLREKTYIDKTAIPNEDTKDKDFFELIDMPSYKDLEKQVKKLEGKQETALNLVRQLKHSARYERCMHELDFLEGLLGDVY